MSTETKRRKILATTSPEIQELNSRLDRINSKINPLTPYMLIIPTTAPTVLRHHQLRRVWVHNTPFTYDEGELQYLSSFHDWSSTLIQAIGDWDDGKGGIAKKIATPPTQSAQSTPQQVAKKIKLGEYAAKKAAGGTPLARTLSSSEGAAPKSETMKQGFHPEHLTNGTVSKSSLGKRSRDELEIAGKLNGKSGLPEKKPRNSPLMDDEKPTLPPPMTPLPKNLREATAAWIKERAEGERLKDETEEKLLKPKQTAVVSPRPLITAAPEGERRAIVLKFRKRRQDFARLSKTSRSKSHPSTDRLRSPDQVLHTPDRPTASVKSATPQTISPSTSKIEGKNKSRAEDSVAWNTLAVFLKKRWESPELRQSQPREAFVLLIAAIAAFMVQGTLIPPVNERAARIVWDGARGVISRFRDEELKGRVKIPEDAEPMQGLLYYLEAYICRERAYLRPEASESASEIKAMSRCLQRSALVMNPVALQEHFPRSWAAQSSPDTCSSDSSSLTKPLAGTYTLCPGTGSALTAARVARVMIAEWCERHNVHYDDDLSRSGM